MNIAIIGAGIAIALTGVGVVIGDMYLARRGIDALGKNPNLSGGLIVFMILGLALVESAAIYGLIIAFQILDGAATLSAVQTITAGLAIGLPGLMVAIGEGWVIGQAIDSFLRNPEARGKVMTNMILAVALIESIAIYGLIIAFRILG